MAASAVDAPRAATVVGAGVVGLSTAWYLQEHGIEVTVLERDRVASGASWGNAGWLSPALAVPLNTPDALAHGARSLVDPHHPLSVPRFPGAELARFLTLFAMNSTHAAHNRALLGNAPLSRASHEAFDELLNGGVGAVIEEAPITALFFSEKRALGLVSELREVAEAGIPADFTPLDAQDVRELVPVASDRVRAGVRIHGQRHLNPALFTHALADSVRSRGGRIVEGFPVAGVRPPSRAGDTFTLTSEHGETESAEVLVAATGAWLGRRARRWGVRTPVAAGRGYSFTVGTDRPVPGPVYLPEARVACTPLKDGMRVAGTMEFAEPDAPADHARVEAVVRTAAPYLDGVGLEQRVDTWVGPRPVSADGLPLVGPTRVPGLYVAGGHGMWGLTHGPATGRLLARAVATGNVPPELEPFDPTR
ncbi:FAD-binding oxidoreductase [Nocardiopsis sp. HNM0947]|uniref:FAD-binding oxidoreductase n=1 Tax=Nocardiopsis coralli TaxID=2772213 RepID=A0ABR9PF19_9ACTN|nr:FAD-dependent oxidoreductase [Nocardiopsis coralli]MBE3002442.1 FAD-binding oxidoreductase [Nocardiopsis coralli]